MRIVFMGTPQFAVPVLDALVCAGHEIAAVVSQPDREKDKKGNLMHSPVKEYALGKGFDCLQFDKVSLNVDAIAELAPEVMVTAAYGQILSKELLAVPKYGVLNVHASLLPKYRGSSPVQSAILCGETETGVTIMKTDVGMDTGDMLASVKVGIDKSDTTDGLSAKLSRAGAKLLTEVLPDYVSGKITAERQNDSKATYCKKIVKADGLIDWTRPAHEIMCKIRAFNPWPIAFSYLDGAMLKIYSAEERADDIGEAGGIFVRDDGLFIACGKGSVRLTSVQLPGKKVLRADEFVRGKKIAEGSVLKNV